MNIFVVEGLDESDVVFKVLVFQMPKVDAPDKLLDIFFPHGPCVEGNMYFFQLGNGFVAKPLEKGPVQEACQNFKEVDLVCSID